MTTSTQYTNNTDNTSEEMKKILDKFYVQEIAFPSNQIDAVIGYFLKRGYNDQAAKSISIYLLNQARIDNVNVFQLIDKLKQLSNEQLNIMMVEVTNTYRNKTSVLGYKVDKTENTTESRNIVV